jgi:hypothetical protein
MAVPRPKWSFAIVHPPRIDSAPARWDVDEVVGASRRFIQPKPESGFGSYEGAFVADQSRVLSSGEVRF